MGCRDEGGSGPFESGETTKGRTARVAIKRAVVSFIGLDHVQTPAHDDVKR